MELLTESKLNFYNFLDILISGQQFFNFYIKSIIYYYFKIISNTNLGYSSTKGIGIYMNQKNTI